MPEPWNLGPKPLTLCRPAAPDEGLDLEVRGQLVRPKAFQAAISSVSAAIGAPEGLLPSYG